VTTVTEAAAAGRVGTDAARDLTAYLRSQPELAAAAGNAGGLTLSRTRLAESLMAIRKGDKPVATRLALSAYLDGFEPLEPSLGARNKALLSEVENGMLAYRSAIANGTLAQAEAAAQKLDYLFAEVEKELGGESVRPAHHLLGLSDDLAERRARSAADRRRHGCFPEESQSARRPTLRARWLDRGVGAGGLTWVVGNLFCEHQRGEP